MRFRRRFVLWAVFCSLARLLGMVSTGKKRGPVGRWPRWALVVLAVAGVAVGAGAPGTGGVPPEVANLLPHAVLFWQSAELRPLGEPRVMEFLGVADTNGDGFLDIICSHRTRLIVFFGDGTGKFVRNSACGIYEATEKAVGGGWFQVEPLARLTALSGVIADLDDEGNPEVIVGVVGTQTPGGPYGSWLYTFTSRDGCLSKAWASPLPFKTHFLAMTGPAPRGAPGILAVSVEDRSAQVFVLPREGKFAFASPRLVAEAQGWPFFFRDVDGDGLYDLALRQRKGVTVLRGDEHGGFKGVITFEHADGPVRGAALGDLTGDGVLELVVSTPQGLVVARQADGSFKEVGRCELRWGPESVDLADLTGDGRLDALVSGSYGQALVVLPGDGQGGFLDLGSDFWVGFPGARPVVVDLNGDGRSELLVVHPYQVSVWMSGGCPQGTSLLPIGGPYLLAAGDLAGNGTTDLVTRRGRAVEVLWNDGRGAFVRHLLTEFPRPGPGTQLLDYWGTLVEAVVEPPDVFLLRRLVPIAAAVADGSLFVLLERTEVNNRTLMERVVFELRWLATDGTELGAHRLGADAVPVLTAGDLDGDGNADVVMLKENGLLVLWGGQEALASYPLFGAPTLATVADFTGDGVDDVALVIAKDYAELVILSFQNREPVLSEVRLQFDVLSVPLALSSGDFDRDGIADPVAIAITLMADQAKRTVEISSAELGVYLSQKGAVTYPIPEFPKGDAPWPITGLAVGDFTGDGMSDLVYTTVSGNGVFLLPGRGDGTFGTPRRFPVQGGPLLSGDLDASGQDEVVVTVQGSSPMIWILWNGGGR